MGGDVQPVVLRPNLPAHAGCRIPPGEISGSGPSPHDAAQPRKTLQRSLIVMTIIDARLRPPLKDYLRCNLYRDPKKTQGWSNNFLMKVSPAVEQRDADLLYREMDDAGVTLGVMTGRQSPDMGNVSNDDLMDVVREQPSRFVGIAGVDGSDPIAAIAEIERTVANGNLRGAGMEPGCGAIPMYVDDARLYPILSILSRPLHPHVPDGRRGQRAGSLLQQPRAHRPRLPRFSEAGRREHAWVVPWVPQVLFSCMCRPNMYLAPDMYMYNMPGAADYVTAANGFLRDRFLFGSGYPYIPLKQAVDLFVAMPFDRSILPNLLYKNMARVLKLDVD